MLCVITSIEALIRSNSFSESCKFFTKNFKAICSFEAFNTNDAVFYDYDSDFQCMETTISGMADGIYFFTLINKIYGK